MTEPGFMENVNARGEQLMEGLQRRPGARCGHAPGPRSRPHGWYRVQRCPRVAAIQALSFRGHPIVMDAGTYGRTLGWMPPLVVNEREIDLALAAFGGAVKATTWSTPRRKGKVQ